MENQTPPSAQTEPAVKYHDPKAMRHAALIAARKLIEKPENWTQGENARDIDRRPVPPTSATAVCWCAMGAIDRATGSLHFSTKIYDALADAIPDKESVVKFNDALERTHAEVLAAFDRAIELCGTVTVTTPAEQRTVA